ncbi:MAG: hypothetical protein Fur0037_25480 [Planctomycetota bacterium]
MILFLAGLFGFALVILVCGMQTREQERREMAQEPEVEAPPRSFFATLADAFEPANPVDDEAVRKVEHQLRLLTAQAHRYVESPSIDRFHDFGGETPVEEESIFCRFQRFLQQERQLAGEFVADPSLQRLQTQAARRAV